jgi:hypothetical protein
MPDCRKCNKPIPLQKGPGQPRAYCEVCRPPRTGQEAAPVVSIAPSAKRTAKTVAASTLADLERAGQEETTEGVVALHLAELLDAGQYTAQGAAALVKAHREALDLALAAGQSDADVIDLIFGESS